VCVYVNKDTYIHADKNPHPSSPPSFSTHTHIHTHTYMYTISRQEKFDTFLLLLAQFWNLNLSECTRQKGGGVDDK